MSTFTVVGKTSKVSKATTTSSSVRATIPEDIAEDLGLVVGDTIEWDTVSEKGKRYARFRKLE